ncbi:MAG TPA: 30S ribosomal protein S12 methylthiotransferase RimO [Segeticoccus sp.]|uniref:30S ribosomal protein S12 methylthiotransferase RimO n=1 Tax=Segeticoccus sp. TaxID=2706531 RepID=UPI002D808360|nr:30S ribosomal protein S12 methylthiotransferase RimO [Segeticoccus sp.]HET8598880.1 30S ribosomal protein S12 methylthiotransferase RimO [Segeticoccus sp.]
MTSVDSVDVRDPDAADTEPFGRSCDVAAEPFGRSGNAAEPSRGSCDVAAEQRTVALVTLGCARNEVDSEELAGRLSAQGWTLVDDAADADVAVVNTCGFVEQAKKDSIDALLEASDLKESGRTQAVVAVGCLAERYGEQLASQLPEADAVLGFDSYTDMSSHLNAVLHGERPASHVPRDRRTLLPISPAARHTDPADGAPTAPRQGEPGGILLPAHGVTRARLDGRPWAPLKIANGCDRRCAFCAIPMFRGAFLSRRPTEVLEEARWLAERGVKEVFLVSENSTSYGKDLGDLRLLETMLPELAAIDGIERVRVSYLQPAEMRPGLLEAMAGTPGVVPYFDLSFQHASAPLLRRMRRFGSRQAFLDLIGQVRDHAPLAGIRSNVIVGFPGETEEDVAELEAFLQEARLDVVGVFGYSDEDGTEGETLDGKLPEDVVAERVERLRSLTEELANQRAEERVGETLEVLVEEVGDDEEEGPGDGLVPVTGRAAHQGPDVDGVTVLHLPAAALPSVGDLVSAAVVGTEGIDLLAELRAEPRGAGAA